MGERKVLNKYYPPDFDHSKLPRRRQPKNKQMTVRMMLPMSIRCGTCGNYIYKGTKFNSRKEDAVGEKYLGIQIFRFYFKNFEPWRAADEETEEEKRKRIAEERGDAMKSLENKTHDSKREMDILATLDEMKSMKSRHAAVSVDAMLEALQRSNERKELKLEEEDEALIKSVFKGKREAVVLKRIDDDYDDDSDWDLDSLSGSSKRIKMSDSKSTDSRIKESVDDSSDNRDNGGVHTASGDNGKFVFKSRTVRVSVMKKSGADSDGNKGNEKRGAERTASGLLSLCQQYGSDDDDL
ncbi:hypothetical protein MIMGU_mgv1a011004mg [Erythranthe guttata]|uniref:Splicing factor YJU2 n=1 Tax=Erythranthe guttata TaxID=4155 RepID=A0A022QZ06_ERYGU|nr:hypothetical protein MIMGU_mgv1a011004mg [Erythranthe guttata]